MSAEVELAKLERQLLAIPRVKGWLDSIDELRKLLALESPEIRRALLELVAPKIEKRALKAVVVAFAVGRADALSIVRDPKVVKRTAKAQPSKAARDIVRGIDGDAVKALDVARRLMKAGRTPAEYLAPLFGHANKVRGVVTDAINLSSNEGVARVATVAKLPLVWVAETNACVHCLAYSGRVAKPGKPFPGGLTYGAKSYHPETLKTPPLHPHCRCTLEPLNDPSYAEALRREADRSVLRGFSLSSESMKVRIDAAERLVASGVDAPKSVVAYARTAIRKGEFPNRGR